MITQHDINQKQYQNKSLDYLNSQAHSEGIEFNKFINEIQKIEKAVVLDLGCGGGHVSYNVAPHADLVFAYDLSHEMLDTVSKTASQRKLKTFLCSKALLRTCLLVISNLMWSLADILRITGNMFRLP